MTTSCYLIVMMQSYIMLRYSKSIQNCLDCIMQTTQCHASLFFYVRSSLWPSDLTSRLPSNQLLKVLDSSLLTPLMLTDFHIGTKGCSNYKILD